ncbi:MAG: hypothetical protein EU531_08490 [Promethearchaeota archaeon]|nr:MAG: hypothetical protein EU531_08490 [Candidatus Lokiarchaeota archaeon]
METLIKFADKIREKEPDQDYRDYISDFSKGYLELEFQEKQNQINDYINAYELLDDKESFHAQYLLSLIENLKFDF